MLGCELNRRNLLQEKIFVNHTILLSEKMVDDCIHSRRYIEGICQKCVQALFLLCIQGCKICKMKRLTINSRYMACMLE